MENSALLVTEKNKLYNIEKIGSLLNKDYLYKVENRYGIVNFSDYNKIPDSMNGGPQYKISQESNIRALQIDRWVFDKEEQSIDKFKNILSVFTGGDSNLALLVHRDKEGSAIYLILKNETTDKTSRVDMSNSNVALLESAILGNFNGASVKTVDDFVPNIDKITSISCLTNIPSEKSERFISQGLEKLLDGIKPENDGDDYYILILAEPLSHKRINDIQSGYEDLASAIVPYAGYQLSIGKNNTETEGTTDTLTDSESISSSVAKAHSVSISEGGGVSVGEIGYISANTSYGFNYSETEGKGISKASTKGTNYNLSVGTTENNTYNYQSFAIKGLLEKLQKQLNRVNNGHSIGLWKCASYVLAASPLTTINVANFLKSLTQGDESYIEPPIINTWNSGSPFFSNIIQYLTHFTHPIFFHENEYITPSYNISTTELSNIMALPRKSISGLPVIECAGFGRDVISLNKSEKDIKIKIGYLFHMHCMEKNKLIGFNKKNLASHTFITGSTGSGKSNTVYQLLSEITKSDARFLVIEPAKGEYKNIFGNLDGVFVYGTNPELSPLLKINPFKFPTGNSEPKKNIHILEHLDRLIEIFNVCWPMYAAMPAVLKNAVEKSYEEAGWDLKKSKNKYNFELYPSFVDIIQNVKRIIDSSEYSDENKGNYKGSLITRLESLTNGLNSLIFVNDELSNTDLFDKNVIVDLSRIGSMETKALIMGLLVMKLQEYRMTSGKTNADLNHVTVLEEAHNLLKRTSTEQSSESANLLGKSVEMLANAIAEMRTYGEGFIIADQSPGLLDMSVIRNTNTKIILRLPDASDRELVGKAANLNEDQIIEISRFPLGVAAIYQNDWIEPVLCKVEEFKDKKPYHFENKDLDKLDDLEKLKTDITSYLLSNITNDPVDKDIDALKERIYKSNLSTGLKLDIIDYITKHYPPKELADIYGIISEIYKPSYKFIEKYAKAKDINNRWAKQLLNEIEPSIIDFNGNIQRLILCTIFYKLYRQNVVSLEFYKKWENYYLQR